MGFFKKQAKAKAAKKAFKKSVPKAIREYVKQALIEAPEMKNIDLQLFSNSVPSTTALTANPAIPIQGLTGGANGTGTRIGDSIDLHSLEIIWSLTGSNTNIAGIANFVPNTTITILIGLYKHPEGIAAPSPPPYGMTGVYDLTTLGATLYPNAPYTKSFRSSWTELYRKQVTVTGWENSNSVAGPMFALDSFEKEGKKIIPLKGHKMKFISNSGTVTSVSQGLPFVIVYGSDPNTYACGFFNMWCRLNYTDS